MRGTVPVTLACLAALAVALAGSWATDRAVEASGRSALARQTQRFLRTLEREGVAAASEFLDARRGVDRGTVLRLRELARILATVEPVLLSVSVQSDGEGTTEVGLPSRVRPDLLDRVLPLTWVRTPEGNWSLRF